MSYRKDWLSGEDLVAWASKNYPEVKIRKRHEKNNYAEARLLKTGILISKFTSNRSLKDHMETEQFKRKLRIAKKCFGIGTAVFKGFGY